MKHLGGPLTKADREDREAAGRVNVRRLTRREYEHTVHDLLGVDLPLADLLPEDVATHGFETVALLDHQGNVTEGPGFNVFAVRDGRVVTPDRGVLHGITRQTVLDICAEQGIETESRALPSTGSEATPREYRSQVEEYFRELSRADDAHDFDGRCASPWSAGPWRRPAPCAWRSLSRAS